MNIFMRYQKPLEKVEEQSVELHKNAKGYNIQLDGKFYFPRTDNPVIKNLDKYKKQELYVVLIKDEINYGSISFAVPDFFIRFDLDKKTVWVEKEVPLILIDNPDQTYKWDYVTLAKCSSIDQTDKFIDDLENKYCPEVIIKEAIKTFYDIIN